MYGEWIMSSRNIQTDEMRRQAEVRFGQAKQRQADAMKALHSQHLTRDAVLAKTVRLRALRLTKEAEEAEVKKRKVASKGAKKLRATRAALVV
jgi:hypothetical protein